MKRLFTLLFTCLFTLLFTCLFAVSSTGQPAGIVTVVSETLIETEVDAIFKQLETDLVGKNIGDIKTKLGKIDWGLKDISVYHFTSPQSNIELSSSKDKDLRVTARLSEGVIKVSVDWWARYDTFFHDFHIGGSAYVKFYGVDITKTVDIDIKDGALRLEPCPSCCKIQIEDTSISVYGNTISWIMDKVIGWFDTIIEDKVTEEACVLLNKLVTTDVNEILTKIPTKKTLWNGYEMDYTPVYIRHRGDCVELGLTGLFSHSDAEVDMTSLQGVDLPSECTEYEDNFQIKISDQTLVSLLDVLRKTGSLQYTVDKDKIKHSGPMFQPGFFARSEDELLQHFFVKIVINTTSTPTVNVDQKGIHVIFPVTLDMVMQHPNEGRSKRLLLTSEADVHVGLKMKLVEKDKSVGVTAEITDTRVVVRETSSSKGNYTIENVSSLLHFISNSLLRHIGNQHLMKGVQLDVSKVFQLETSTLEYLQGHIGIHGRMSDW